MSEENQEVGEQANALDTNELMAEIEKLKSTNERLLAESKNYKTRKSEVEEMAKKLEQYEQQKLEETGNYQEMLKREQEKRRELEQNLRAKDEKILKSNVFNYVSNYAKDAHDINDLLAQREYASMIEIDDDSLEPVAESVQKFVDSLRNDKKYLFKGHKVASMADSKPTADKPREKTLAQMSDSERRKILQDSLRNLPTR